MITNNSCRKLPIIRRYTAKNIPDNKCMRKTNLRKTYIPFSLSRTDTKNMSVIYIFDDFQIYTKLGSGLSVTVKAEAGRKWKNYRLFLQEICRKAVQHLLKAGITFQLCNIKKLENWTIHLITDRLLSITVFIVEVVMKDSKGICCLNSHFFRLPVAVTKI